MNSEKRELLSSLSVVSSMGISIALAIGIGVWIGLKLDQWLDTKPRFFYIFLFIGIAAGFRNIYIIASREIGKDERSKK